MVLKYAKIIDNTIGLCEVGVGTNSKFYQSIGMSRLDVQQSDIDGAWYLKDKCPMKSEEEKLKQAQQSKLQEASNKAFEYRNITGLVSFNARPVDTSLLEEGESTLVLHTELLNQNDFFQRMTGFSTGMFTDDIIYNTKEDILVYLNAEETQAIYYAIIDRAGRLWNEDYMTYKALIEGCTTAEEVQAIVIDYDNVPVIEGEVTDENTTDTDKSNVPNELDTTTGQSDETNTDKTE